MQLCAHKAYASKGKTLRVPEAECLTCGGRGTQAPLKLERDQSRDEVVMAVLQMDGGPSTCGVVDVWLQPRTAFQI